MRYIFLLCFIVPILDLKAQQSFRIDDFPRVFHGAISNTFNKKINDTLTLHGVYQNPNYQISLVTARGAVLCSCLNELSGVVETSSESDSTVQIKVLEPVNNNCIKRFRHLVDRKLQ